MEHVAACTSWGKKINRNERFHWINRSINLRGIVLVEANVKVIPASS